MSDERRITYIINSWRGRPGNCDHSIYSGQRAMAMDVTPVIILQSNGVMLGVKGYADKVHFKEGDIAKTAD